MVASAGTRVRRRPSASVTPAPSWRQAAGPSATSRVMATPAAGRPSAVSRTWVVIPAMVLRRRRSGAAQPLLQADVGDLALLLGGDGVLGVGLVVEALA